MVNAQDATKILLGGSLKRKIFVTPFWWRIIGEVIDDVSKMTS